MVYLYGPQKCGKTTISQMWLEVSKGIYISGKEAPEATLAGFPPAWTGLNGATNEPTSINGATNVLGYRK